MLKSSRRNQAGDTLIEVLLSATALALVLSISFISANRSLRTGTDAANRNQAVQYASQQIEFLKLGIYGGTLITSGAGINIPAGDFCMNPSTHAMDLVLSDCSQGGFDVKIDFSDPTFTIQASWPSTLTQQTDNVTMYYQDPQ
jgi:type II secretory pathway pseudopilin PulG